MEPYRSSLEPVPCKQSTHTRVDPIPNGSEHIRSHVNVALVSTLWQDNFISDKSEIYIKHSLQLWLSYQSQPKLKARSSSRSLFSSFRQRLHETGSVSNRYGIGTDKPCVYTGPGGSSTDRICSLVPDGSTYEGDSMWTCRSLVNRVDPYQSRSDSKRI